MIYSETEFEKFSKPPFKYELQQVIDTHMEIRNAINNNYNRSLVKDTYKFEEAIELDTFLQGSYSNHTNVTKSSDVDIVVRLKNVWRSDTQSLSNKGLEMYKSNTKNSLYQFGQFNNDILRCLYNHFGSQCIINDEKCIRLRGHQKYCDTDIVPAYTYKLYEFYDGPDKEYFKEGICFDTNSGYEIINYPKQHHASLIKKSQETNGCFKESVRMFKNIKDELITNHVIGSDIVKSYYIENLLFNIPNNYFSGSFKDRFLNISSKLINHYNDGSYIHFKCTNGIHGLFDSNIWKASSYRSLLEALILIRDKNHF